MDKDDFSEGRSARRNPRSQPSLPAQPDSDDSDQQIKAAFKTGLNRAEIYVRYGICLIAAWLLIWTSWYYNSADQNTVVQRFGALVRVTGPGPHLKWPWPIEDYTKVRVTKIQRLEIGYKTVEQGPPAKYEEHPEEAEMLTGDLNIAEVEWIKQFKTGDAAKWLFSVKDPEDAVRFISESSMRQVVAGVTFDDVATTGRAVVQVQEQPISQQLADRLGLGVQFTLTQLQDVLPPKEVRDSFRDVTNAKEEQQQSVQKAQAYANKVVPEARGNAAGILNESLGYKQQHIDWAQGDVARFTDILAKYKQAPDITTERIRMETVEDVLKGRQIIVDRTNQSPLKLFHVNGGSNQPQ